MATNIWVNLPVESGGGVSITSINGATGPAITIVGGTGISVGTVGNTITISDTNVTGPEAANTVFAGPTTGAAAPPTFRALVAADFPAGTGTVTSVALTSPGVLYTVSGSPITTSGTLALNLINQTANTVLAGPTSGGAAAPTFRALTGTDIGGFTSGSVIFAGPTGALSQDNANFFWNDTNFSLGISNNAPAAATFIDAINNSGATKRLLLTGYGTASLVGMRTRLARGTVGSPTAVQTGDILGFYNAEGYGTSQFPATATGAISIIAGETFTNTSNLTYVTINSTPTGAVTSTENFRVASTGVTIGPQSASTLINTISGGLNVTTRSINANTTLDTTTTDYLVFVDTSGGAVTVTLPTPTNGRVLIIKDSTGSFGTNNCTIARHAAEKIEGLATSKILQTNWGSSTFSSNGTDWFMI